MTLVGAAVPTDTYDPNKNYGDSPALSRVQQLSVSHSWLPLQTMAALASSGLSDTDINTTVEGLRQAALKSDQIHTLNQGLKAVGQTPQRGPGFSYKLFFDDPVLQKAPSVALALKQYVAGTIGSWPVTDSNLAHIQQQLQLRGYGRDLPADGTWNPGWDAAHRQYADGIYRSELSGNKPGSISLGKAMQALQALQPTSAWNATIGFLKAIPSGGRDLLAHLAGGVAQLGSDIYNVPAAALSGQGVKEGFHRSNVLGTNVMASIESGLGHPTTGSEILHRPAKQVFADFLQDASNIYLLTSAMSVGSRFSQAIAEEGRIAGTEEATRLGLDAATRGPGAIARTLGTPVGRTIAGAGLGGIGTAAAGGNTKQILGGAALGGALGYATTTKAFTNLPVLGRTGPVIDSLLDADGLYYRTRSLLAAPYQYAPVRLAGQAVQDTTLFGAKVRGLAAAQSALSPTSMSQAVQGTHTLDTINDAIKHRLDFSILGAHIAPSLDDLIFFLHGPTHGPLTASASIGHETNSVLHAYEAALGEPGWDAAIQRITGQSTKQTVEALGGLDNHYNFWSNKIAEHAAWWAAENGRMRDLQAAGESAYESLSDPARIADLQARAGQIRRDPDALAEAVNGFSAQGLHSGIEEFIARMHREIQQSGASPKAFLQHAGKDYLDAARIAREQLLPALSERVSTAPAESQLAAHGQLLNASGEPGSLGLARLDTFSRQDAYRAIHDLETEFNDLQAREGANANTMEAIAVNPTPPPKVSFQERPAWDQKANDLLYHEFGIDGRTIPERGAEKLGLMRDKASQLAVDVLAHPDADPAVHQAFADIARLGYKPVSGTDIGWMLHGPSPVDVLQGPLTFQRQVADKLSISARVIPDQTIASYRNSSILGELTKTIQSGEGQLPPYADARTLMALLQQEGFVDRAPGRFKSAIQELFRTPQRVAKAEHISVEEARLELNQALQLRDIPRARVVAALRDVDKWNKAAPASIQAMSGLDEIPHEVMSVDSAEAFYRALVKGSSNVPGYMLGASRLEDLFRASMGFAGNGVQYRAGAGALLGAGAAYAVDPTHPNLTREIAGASTGAIAAAAGGDRLGWAMANLPNKLIQLRNEFRFDLSPWFSFRRIAKVNVKLWAEGVQGTMNPLGAMEKAGTLTEDRAILARVRPALYNSVSDDADRYLQSQDIFGFYNHRNYEAYAVGKWARQGLTDDEINSKLTRVFEYGTGNIAGRSPLERTTNFFFFPFSFDKTLYRNLGGYLLDRPAQRVLLTRALAGYDEFNRSHQDGSNPLSTAFYAKHLPVLEEAAQLNAFTHGISLGEPGGINRPLLNLFLPQSWSSSPDNLATLKRFIPAVKDFQRVYQETMDQGSILHDTGINMWRDLQGIPATYANPARSTLTKQAQLEEAFNMQREWFSNYAAVIDHNNATRDTAKKINFPLSAEWGKYAGEPITKSNIRELIHLAYPAYNPEGAVIAATSASRDFTQYLLDTKNTSLHDYISQFATDTRSLGSGMNVNKFSGADVASLTASLRAQATYIAQQDPRFYALYSKNFRRILGPLEGVK